MYLNRFVSKSQNNRRVKVKQEVCVCEFCGGLCYLPTPAEKHYDIDLKNSIKNVII